MVEMTTLEGWMGMGTAAPGSETYRHTIDLFSHYLVHMNDKLFAIDSVDFAFTALVDATDNRHNVF